MASHTIGFPKSFFYNLAPTRLGLGLLGGVNRALFFEGSEKKVEMIFDEQMKSLRDWPTADWHTIVAEANATVLSQISNPACDAYLLSESSLFVYKDRLIMITCGETSLISAIEAILEKIGLATLRLLVFERKNEMLPAQQPSDFEQDVAYLKKRMGGGAMRFGGDQGNYVQCYYYSNNYQPNQADTTLEILMHDLDTSAEKRFIKANRHQLYQNTEINQLFPGFQTDDFFFDPMGYSLNSIGGQDYYTIHVTPQTHCSYASFETNYCGSEGLMPTVERVLSIFKPKSFSLLIFESEHQPELQLPAFQLRHRQIHQYAGYRVRFYDYLDPAAVDKTTGGSGCF